MIRETEAYIEWGLKHPEEVIHIPVKPANNGGFPAAVGKWFWKTVLPDDPGGKLRRWRNLFRGRKFNPGLFRRP